MEQYDKSLMHSFGQHEYMDEPCSDCERCLGLVKSRKQVTYGFGSLKSKIMFTGDAPGQNGCNITGMPFTRDRGGVFFQHCLAQARFNYEKVYTTNVVKCAPSGNRPPDDIEVSNCLPYLKNEIKAIRPELVVCLGRTAAKVFLGTGKFSVIADEGSLLPSGIEWYDGKVIVMPHPAYILRQGKKETGQYLQEFKYIFNLWLSAIKADTKITDERWN